MDQAQLITRLLAEVGAARAAILASYSRLWRPDAGSPSEPRNVPPGPELGPTAGTSEIGGEHDARDPR